jgi:hypothetical protein
MEETALGKISINEAIGSPLLRETASPRGHECIQANCICGSCSSRTRVRVDAKSRVYVILGLCPNRSIPEVLSGRAS